MSQSLQFTEEDSSSGGLTIEPATEGGHVRLSGGIDIPFSKLTTAAQSIRQRVIDENARPYIKAVSLKDLGITDYGQLSTRGNLLTAEGTVAAMTVSVDGKNLDLAAWPNKGEGWQTFKRRKYASDPEPADSDVVTYGTRSANGIAKGCSFRYTDSRLEQWSRPELAWVSGALGPNYASDYYPVQSIDPSTKTVTLREGAITPYYSKPNFRYENILEELDRPGEYYIDRENGTLYLYPPENTGRSSVITLTMMKAPLIQLVEAKNITLRGLELTGGRMSGISTAGAAGIDGVTVEDCTVHGFGKHGIYVKNGRSTQVRDCEIYDIGETGIEISGGDYNNIISAQNVVYGNDIHDFGQIERSYRPGVLLGYQSVGAKVQHNYIHDAPHTGLIFYGVNHLIENNYFERLVMEFHDMDAIYANNVEYPWERGNQICRNYFTDIGNQVLAEWQMNISAIRTDNIGHGLTVYQNVFHHVGAGGNTNAVSGVRAQGTYNRIYENLFVDCAEAYNSNTTYNPDRKYDLTQAPYDVRARELEMRLPVYGLHFPELSRMWEEHPQAVQTNEFYHNVIVNMEFPLSTINGAQEPQGFRGAPELVKASGNLVTRSDPGFADYAGGDFSVRTGSDAYNAVNGHTSFQIVCKGKKQ